jgi:hypothetical protein
MIRQTDYSNREFTVGEPVFLLENFFKRRPCFPNGKIMPLTLKLCRKYTYKAKITSVGERYITVESDDISDPVTFDKVNGYWQSNKGSCDYLFFTTEEEITRNVSTENLYEKIREQFQSFNSPYTLEQLTAINKIIKEK